MFELKSCPFCGSEALISWNNKFGWQAFCENDSCFMSQIIATTFETVEQAIQSWNNRTQYDKHEPEIVRCKDCKHYEVNTGRCAKGITHGYADTWTCGDAEKQ